MSYNQADNKYLTNNLQYYIKKYNLAIELRYNTDIGRITIWHTISDSYYCSVNLLQSWRGASNWDWCFPDKHRTWKICNFS